MKIVVYDGQVNGDLLSGAGKGKERKTDKKKGVLWTP